MTTPVIVSSAAQLRELTQSWREKGQSIGFVPTMGSLHEGHLALVEAAASETDRVVVSIFVNPLQFGAGEDFDRYPRSLTQDALALSTTSADAIFAPSVEEIYPDGLGATPTLSSGHVGLLFEGLSRPGHFDGMLTVVARLCHLVGPDRAYFGQKDAQQVFLIRHMVKQEGLPLEVVSVPTIRGVDRLALSSRNAFLSAEEHQRALAIPRALEIARGCSSADQARAKARSYVESAPGVEVDYLGSVDPETFEPWAPGTNPREGLMIVAATIGATRLIDNQVLAFGQ